MLGCFLIFTQIIVFTIITDTTNAWIYDTQQLMNYRINLIKHPGRLLNFWTLRVRAYSRLGAYYIFTI